MFDLKAIIRLLLQPGVLPVFLVKVVSGFPSGESRLPGAQWRVLGRDRSPRSGWRPPSALRPGPQAGLVSCLPCPKTSDICPREGDGLGLANVAVRARRRKKGGAGAFLLSGSPSGPLTPALQPVWLSCPEVPKSSGDSLRGREGSDCDGEHVFCRLLCLAVR